MGALPPNGHVPPARHLQLPLASAYHRHHGVPSEDMARAKGRAIRSYPVRTQAFFQQLGDGRSSASQPQRVAGLNGGERDLKSGSGARSVSLRLPRSDPHI